MCGPRMSCKHYHEYIKTMEAPIMPSELPEYKIDLRALVKYAREHDISVADLSKEDKENLMKMFEKK